jgi:hypothetical protein
MDRNYATGGGIATPETASRRGSSTDFVARMSAATSGTEREVAPDIALLIRATYSVMAGLVPAIHVF